MYVSHITIIVDDEERKSLFIPFGSFETFEYPELGTTKKKYPYDNLNLDFAKNSFTLLYDIIRNPILSPSTFLTHAPIIVIDTSKQNDSTTVSLVDVQLEIEASESL
ncbi:Uncharacterized protein FWK35_00010672 [Aphis craccivora]|uniref:Double jelly roll-like domain-containing protein n=1 Tax=Aphis craccivora TaxID=307492 RepID=A0A6G0ZGX1_APHCR|nr:Uncharacterized protein FWK35_00010672 [Aphis craccivora]